MLADLLSQQGGRVYTLTTYGRGERDYVRIFTVNALGKIIDITTYISMLTNRHNYGKAKGGLGYGGGQYNKGLEAADDAWRAAYGRPIPQENWEEL